MHLQQKLVLAAFLMSVAFFSCKNEPSTGATTVTDPNKPERILVQAEPELSAEGAATYKVTESTVQWWASQKVGGGHNGTIRAHQGELLVKEGRLIGGSVVIDMSTIMVDDLKDASEKAELEEHLKAKDFFDAKKYPKGEFKILEVLPSKLPEFDHVISGDLTLKGKTNTVNVPVKLSITANELRAESVTFVIDRTQWGINYNSPIIGTIGDKVIENNLNLRLSLKAVKQ